MIRVIAFFTMTTLVSAIASCSSIPRSGRIDSSIDDAVKTWHRTLPYIDMALGKIGRDRSTIALPQAYEVSYRLTGRVPIVDESMRNPLAMPPYAIDAASRISRSRDSLLDLVTVAADMLGAPIEVPSRTPTVDLKDAVERLFDGQAFEDRENFSRYAATLDPALAGAFADLFVAIHDAAVLRREALAGLTDEQRALLVSTCAQFFVAKSAAGREDLRVYTDSVREKLAVADLAGTIRIDKIIAAGAIVARGIDRAMPVLRSVSRSPAPFHLRTPFGAFVVGSEKDDVHEDDVMLSVDFRGDDVYRGGAGSSPGVFGGISVVIDLAGNDRYETKREFSQGSGVGGVGVLLDDGGDDIYEGGRFCQGSGIIGLGILFDRSGRDAYRSEMNGQGSGIFGIGILADSGGDDAYTVGLMGQGFSSTMGIGLLCEYGGCDTYVAGKGYSYNENALMSCAQGFSFGIRDALWSGALTLYGGIAMLADFGGDDTYTIGASGQGAGYVFGLGILVEAAGNDTYRAEDFSCGSGTHLATGIFIDIAGDDVHEGNGHSNGWSLDRAQAVFFDVAGNDRYEGREIAYSGKPKSVGFCVDGGGDDRYLHGHMGDVRPEMKPYLQPVAVFLDLGGNDRYPSPALLNDTSWISNGGGVGMDLTADGREGTAQLHRDETAAGETFLHPEIGSRNLFARYFGERLYRDATPGLTTPLFFSDNLTIRRAAEDILTARFLRGEIGAAWAKPLGRAALVCHDPESRRFIAELLGSVEDADAIRYLKLLLSDENPIVRSYALRSLAQRSPDDAVAAALGMCGSKEPHVRRFAAAALAAGPREASIPAMRSLLADADDGVRTDAARSLEPFEAKLSDPMLLDALHDPSMYVREEAAYALVAHGRTEGIGELIKTLRHPNWVSAELAWNTLRLATNRPLGVKDVAQWEEWWERERERFSLVPYLNIRRFVDKARGLMKRGDDAGAAAMYEKALAVWPDHRMVAQKAASALNSVAWKMVTSDGARTSINKAMEHVRRAIALDPENGEYYDTLAEIHARAGEIDKAIEAQRKAVELSPKNSEFRIRMDALIKNAR